jgi:ComF family protein
MMTAEPAFDPPYPIQAVFAYRRSQIQKYIWKLKYYGHKPTAELFSYILHDILQEMIFEASLWQPARRIIVIPLPNSKERRHERGWNQTELIAGNVKNIPIDTSLLVKIRDIPRQTLLSREERLQNIKNCFEVTDQDKIEDTIVIIFDDVVTTGASLFEALKTVEKAQAFQVIALALAH